MSPGDQSDLGEEGPDLVGLAAVEANAVLQDPASHDPLLELLERRRDLGGLQGEPLLAPSREEVGLQLVLDLVDRLVPVPLLRHQGGLDPALGEVRHGLVGLLGEQDLRLERLRRGLRLRQEVELEVDHLADGSLGGLETLGHALLGRGHRGAAPGEQAPRVVGGLALDHQQVDAAGLVPPTGHDHVERGHVQVLVRRVDAPLPTDQAQPDGAHRAVEREPGDHRRRGWPGPPRGP